MKDLVNRSHTYRQIGEDKKPPTFPYRLLRRYPLLPRRSNNPLLKGDLHTSGSIDKKWVFSMPTKILVPPRISVFYVPPPGGSVFYVTPPPPAPEYSPNPLAWPNSLSLRSLTPSIILSFF